MYTSILHLNYKSCIPHVNLLLNKKHEKLFTWANAWFTCVQNKCGPDSVRRPQIRKKIFCPIRAFLLSLVRCSFRCRAPESQFFHRLHGDFHEVKEIIWARQKVRCWPVKCSRYISKLNLCCTFFQLFFCIINDRDITSHYMIVDSILQVYL